MSFLLSLSDTFSLVFNIFYEKLQIEKIYLALIFAVVGLSLAMLARRITRIIRKKNDIKDDDKVFITIKMLGLIFIFFAMVIIFIILS